MRVPGLATDRRISSACSNKHCTAHWALWAVSAAELPSQHQHQQPQVQKAALSSLAFLAQPRCQVGRRIPRYVATARSGDFFNTTASAQCHVVCWGIRIARFPCARPLHLGPPAAASSAHAPCGPRISSRHQANHRHAVSPPSSHRAVDESQKPPASFVHPPLATARCPALVPSRGWLGRLDGLSALLLAATSPDFAPYCFGAAGLDRHRQRLPPSTSEVQPDHLRAQTAKVSVLPYPFRQPAPPRPAPAWSPSLFPGIPRLFGGSLTDCHNFVRYTLYPVGIWLFLRHGRRAASWDPAPGFHIEHGQPDAGPS